MAAGGTLGGPGQAGYLNGGNGMSIPVRALFAVDALQVPTGSFFMAGGVWYFAVNANNGQVGATSAIVLTGEGAGGFIPNAGGTATYIGGDYSVEVRVDGAGGAVTGDAPWLPAILLGTTHTIFCKQFGSDRLFTLDGHASQGAEVAYDRRRFVKWEGWLVDKAGRTLGDEPLFTVEAS